MSKGMSVIAELCWMAVVSQHVTHNLYSPGALVSCSVYDGGVWPAMGLLDVDSPEEQRTKGESLISTLREKGGHQ